MLRPHAYRHEFRAHTSIRILEFSLVKPPVRSARRYEFRADSIGQSACCLGLNSRPLDYESRWPELGPS